MKNIALYVSGVIFLIMSILQFLRYKLELGIVIGNNHSIPLDMSLYMSIIALVLAIWMFIAALIKKQ